MSDPAHPKVVATAPAGVQPLAIAVRDRRAYVANTGSDTLQVFDVGSPTAPTSLGTIRTGHGPFSVAVDNRYAYVSNAVGRSLQIFDLSANDKASLSFLVGPSLRVTKASAVHFSARCASGGRCVGTVTLTATVRDRRVTLGAVHLSVPGDAARRATIHLDALGRRRVRTAKAPLRARLTFDGTSSASKDVRLVPPSS